MGKKYGGQARAMDSGDVYKRDRRLWLMGGIGPDWAQVHQGASPVLWFPLLAGLSFLYGAGVRIRLSAFKMRLLKRKSLPGFVVSIGNLTAGGTGKTPAVIMLAKWALKEGYRVAILSRGYGGRSKEKVLEVSDGEVIKVDPRDSGDEPNLIARKLTGIPVIVSRKRFNAGLFAHRKFDTNFFILDDGFQHLEIKRDLDLVLIDATSPFGNGHLLPWGPLREPVDQLARADAALLTRFRNQGSAEETLASLNLKFPAIPFFCADHMPASVIFPQSNDVRELDFLKGKRIVAFAGIARPQEFKETLTRLGADLVYFKGFRDHHRFKPQEIRAMIQKKKKFGAQYLLTSEKDWVRIAEFAPVCPEMGYLTIRFALVMAQNRFFGMIKRATSRKRPMLQGSSGTDKAFSE